MVNNNTTTSASTGTGANTQNTAGANQQAGNNNTGTTALEQFGEELDLQNQQYESMQSTEPVDITNEDRFFGAREPIQRGTSVGGVPIFVANQALTPIGILDKKQKAIDEARKKRAEQAAKFKLEKVQRLKNANYQKSFDEAFNANTSRFVNEAKTLYGDDWTLALGSDKTEVGRKYRQSLSNFQTLKDRADQFTDRAAEIKKRIEAGDASVSEKTANMVKEVEGAIGSFSEGKTVDLLGKMDQLNASVNIDSWLNDNIFPNLKQIETKYLSGVMTEEEYKTQISTHTKRILSQAKGIAQRVKKPNGVFGFDENIKEQDIIDAITQRIGDYTVTGPKVVDKPAKPKGKGYTDEDLSNRLSKLNTVSNPFEGGKSKYKDPNTGAWVTSNITTEATAIANELVNSKYKGRIISGAEIKPAGENEDLINTVKSLFSYYQDKGGYSENANHKSTVEQEIKDSKGKLIGSEYNDGTVSGSVKSVDFDEKEDNGIKYGVATVSVQTPEGLKTVEYPMNEANAEAGFNKMRDAFKAQYPDSNDRIELTLIPSSGSDRFARKPVVIDLSEPGAKWTINGILNESASEDTDIPTPDMQMRESGIAAGAEQVNTSSKNNNPSPPATPSPSTQDNSAQTNSFVLGFETQAGGMAGGKAVPLSQYKDKKWESEIQNKYLGSETFKDQFGNTKTGLKNENMFKNSWDKMDNKVKNQLTMYSFNSSWDPRVLAMQAAGILKQGERSKLHNSKELTNKYWSDNQSKINWKDPKLAQNMLNEMADIYKNTFASGESSSSGKLPRNWPSYEARINYIADKLGLVSPLSGGSKNNNQNPQKKEEKPVSSELPEVDSPKGQNRIKNLMKQDKNLSKEGAIKYLRDNGYLK